jgi:hypothetical protein
MILRIDMDETQLMWIFGGFALAVATVGGFALRTSDSVARVERKIGERLVRLETQFEIWLDKTGMIVAKTLHRDDDRLKLDKFLDIYRAHHHDMSMEDWMEFKRVLEKAMDNPLATAYEKGASEWLVELCNHKLSVFQLKETHSRKLIK